MRERLGWRGGSALYLRKVIRKKTVSATLAGPHTLAFSVTPQELLGNPRGMTDVWFRGASHPSATRSFASWGRGKSPSVGSAQGRAIPPLTIGGAEKGSQEWGS